MTTPIGHPDWAGIQQAHGFNRLLSTGPTLAGNGSTTFNIPVVRPGYVINARPQYHSANGANPFTSYQVRWFDSASSADFGPMQTWTVKTLATGIYNPTLGQGPVRGQLMVVTITNLDPAQSVDMFTDIFECSHHISRDDWRDSDMFGFTPAPGFTAVPGAKPSQNVLAQFLITPNGLTNYMLPLYAGQAWLSYQIVVPAGQNGELFICPYDNFFLRYFDSGSLAPGTVTQNAVALTMPRKPCFMQLSHSGATGVQYAVTLTTMEYAS